MGLGIFKLHRRAKPFEVPSGSLVSLWRRRALPSTVTRALTFSFLPKLSPQQVVVLADARPRSEKRRRDPPPATARRRKDSKSTAFVVCSKRNELGSFLSNSKFEFLN